MPTLSWHDIVDFQQGVTGNASVMAAFLLRHARLHSITSPADHQDVEGTPQDGQTLVYDATTGMWRPGDVGGNLCGSLMLMGG